MKSIIRAIFLFPLAALLGLPAHADGTSVVATSSVVSQYMFRGARLGGPSFQPSVEVDYRNFAFGVWANTPIADKVPGQSDPEIDPYVTYTYKVNDSFNIEPGFTWYKYPGADTNKGFFKSTYEPNIALNYFPMPGVKLTPKIYRDMTLKSLTYELTATCATPLKSLATELDWTATGGTFTVKDYFKNAIPREKNWGSYYLVGVSAPFTINKHSKLTVGFAYTAGTGNYIKLGDFAQMDNPAAAGRCVVSLGYSYTF
jgi:uncharacterized protein (TIGR02001 family)